MASGADPPAAVDDDNPTGLPSDSVLLTRTRIQEARTLPQEPPTGLLTIGGPTSSMNSPSSSGDPLMDFSIDDLD